LKLEDQFGTVSRNFGNQLSNKGCVTFQNSESLCCATAETWNLAWVAALC